MSGWWPCSRRGRWGRLARGGFRPRRTLVYAGWDGEEQGLLGSTEWVEAHLGELSAKAVAYINTDSNARGFLSVGGSQALETFVNQALADVRDPLKDVGVLKRARARALLSGSAESRKVAREKPSLAIDPLGSGSDYTPFLQHAGVASLNVGFGDEDEYGQYHSIYDLHHYTRFGPRLRTEWRWRAPRAAHAAPRPGGRDAPGLGRWSPPSRPMPARCASAATCATRPAATP